jgi:hypothetical protein
MLVKLKIIFICNTERLKMTYRQRDVALAWVVAASIIGCSIAPGTAHAQQDATANEEPTPEATEAPPAEEKEETTEDQSPAAEADPTETRTEAEPEEGPTILMPPGEVAPEEPAAGEYGVGVDPLRGMQQARFERAVKTSVGGYGELHLNIFKPEDRVARARLDLHRLVLFIAHNFNDRFRFYTELELEHAFVAEGGGVAVPGSFGVEQAFIDWRILKGVSEALYLRGGVVLVPMGIINQWHEPPIFHGVERPLVDRVIIPTTWREGGIGIWGEPIEGLRYEFYVMGGLDASGFSGSSGLRGGRLQVTQAVLNGPAFTGRLEWEPTLGMVLGIAPYFGLAGPKELDVNVKVGGLAADWRIRRKGFESRAVLAYFHVSDTDALRTVPLGETDVVSDVGSNLFGVYGELGYNVIYYVDTVMELVPFVRVDYFDTTFQEADPAFDLPAFLVPTVGLSYRPIQQVVFKFDYQAVLGSPLNGQPRGPRENRWNVGLGWMF